eukprot:6013101-Prymnesium_polylepis.1
MVHADCRSAVSHVHQTSIMVAESGGCPARITSWSSGETGRHSHRRPALCCSGSNASQRPPHSHASANDVTPVAWMARHSESTAAGARHALAAKSSTS